MQLAAQAHAKRLAVKEQFLLGLWRPLAKWAGVSKEYFATEFPKELAAKLEDVPEEDLQTPKAAIVAPAMEALAYSLDEPALKEMYLNLLAGASLTTKASQVHPSFVDTIRQLSSEEVIVLDLLLKSSIWSLARIKRSYRKNRSYDILVPYLLSLGNSRRAPLVLNDLPSWINNWVRLGLIEVTFTEHRVSNKDETDFYEWVSHRPEFIELKATEPVPAQGEQPDWTIDFDKGLLRITDRGQAFYRVVSSPT